MRTTTLRAPGRRTPHHAPHSCAPRPRLRASRTARASVIALTRAQVPPCNRAPPPRTARRWRTIFECGAREEAVGRRRRPTRQHLLGAGACGALPMQQHHNQHHRGVWLRARAKSEERGSDGDGDDDGGRRGVGVCGRDACGVRGCVGLSTPYCQLSQQIYYFISKRMPIYMVITEAFRSRQKGQRAKANLRTGFAPRASSAFFGLLRPSPEGAPAPLLAAACVGGRPRTPPDAKITAQTSAWSTQCWAGRWKSGR